MRFCALCSLLLLAACSKMSSPPFDAKEFLSSLDGPNVPTVQDTFAENARSAEAQGDFARAAQLYAQALEKQPQNTGLMLSLAENLRRSGELDRSIATYDAVLAADASAIAAKEGKGLALMAKGDLETPGALFGEVLQADATRWKTLNALGILFSARGMQSEAQAYYLEALKFSPSNPAVMNNLGLSQAIDKKTGEAIGNLQQATALTKPGSDDRKRAELNLSLVYAIAGKLTEARAIAERYFSGATLNNNLGLYAHLAKDDQLAKAYLNMALTESKTYYDKAWDNLQAIEGGSAAPQ